MNTELKNKTFILFSLRAVIGLLLAAGIVCGINILIDATQKIHTKLYPDMAKLALDGHVVATPANYDDRRFQVAIIESMQEIPDTIVIGSSRGMYLGEEVTGFHKIYNHCVSGAVIEDDYAILGLYEQAFGKLPQRIIIETSPWCFNGDVPEGRWTENDVYKAAAIRMYEIVNGTKKREDDIGETEPAENPYLSRSYFQYNLKIFVQKGQEVFRDREAKVSTDTTEAADLPDGTIRYAASSENASPERLATVRSVKGALTYHHLDQMTGLDPGKCREYENLLHYLFDQGVEVMIYMAPFSATQCHYIYDENLNPSIGEAEGYLRTLGKKENITVIGGYDARELGIADECFIDRMHLDRQGNRIVWSQ